MRISYLHYLFGAQTGLHHVRQFAKAAQELGHQIEVHAMHPFEAHARHTGSAVPSDGGQVPVRRRRRPVLKRYLSRYLHEPKELLMTASFARREIPLLRASRPDVLLVRNSHLIMSCLPVAHRLGLPLVIELNAPPEEARLYFDQYWHLPFAERLEGWKLRRADGVVVVSTWTKKHLVEHHSVEAEKISVVPNGADLQVFRPGLARDPEIPVAFETAPVVGFVGSFRKWHGSDLLARMAVEVAAARPAARFVFVGEGPEAATVRRMTAPLGGRVQFTGRVSHDRVPGLVAGFDIAVMPESNPYGSPLKVIEWMAAGKAVVAPGYVPLEDVIEDGVEGLLFPPRDGEKLIRAVLRLVDDPDLRNALGRAAVERVRTSLSWEHNARRVIVACERALAQHRPSQRLRIPRRRSVERR